MPHVCTVCVGQKRRNVGLKSTHRAKAVVAVLPVVQSSHRSLSFSFFFQGGIVRAFGWYYCLDSI